MPTLLYREHEIPYTLKPSRHRRTLALQVNSLQQVTVLTPERLSEPAIDRFLRDRAGWVLEKLHYFAELARQYPAKEYVSGENFLVRGRVYRLKVVVDPAYRMCVELLDGRLFVRVDDKGSAQAAVRRWYKAEAERLVKESVERLSPRLGVVPKRIWISNQKQRWASCSSAGSLRFNWRVAMLPGPVLDYVVAHELSHMKVHNHSTGFWSTVRSILPDYEKRRVWLRANGLQFAVT
jgi:predicted metal-dependent hydrolase